MQFTQKGPPIGGVMRGGAAFHLKRVGLETRNVAVDVGVSSASAVTPSGINIKYLLFLSAASRSTAITFAP